MYTGGLCKCRRKMEYLYTVAQCEIRCCMSVIWRRTGAVAMQISYTCTSALEGQECITYYVLRVTNYVIRNHVADL